METTDKKEKNTHHGHAVKRLRKTLNIKQDVLAQELGITQQAISIYEQKKEIEDEMLEKIAKVLEVSPELIRELEEDPVTVIIENNNQEIDIENNNGSAENRNVASYIHEDNSTNNYNPVEKIVELCEKLLAADREKIALLEKLLNEKK